MPHQTLPVSEVAFYVNAIRQIHKSIHMHQV